MVMVKLDKASVNSKKSLIQGLNASDDTYQTKELLSTLLTD